MKFILECMFEILDFFCRKCFYYYFCGMYGGRDWFLKWGLLNASSHDPEVFGP